MAKPFAVQFYKSARWQAIRKLILRRDCYTCKDCGGRATEVHHITELTPSNIDNWDIALGPDNLESLCWDCHKKRTFNESDVPDGYVFGVSGQVVPGRTSPIGK